MKSAIDELPSLCSFLTRYFKLKIIKTAYFLEKVKNLVVDLLMLKRGVLQKKIWHSSIIGLSAFGVVTSGAFGTQTIVSSTFPGIAPADPRFAQTIQQRTDQPILNSLYDTHTERSQRPRDKIIDYEVKNGETLSQIAQKFDIDVDTIKWANNLDSETIKPGQTLKILPISGVAYTVKDGDTLESVAKKFSADAQTILDWPFNDIPDDLSLKVGQELIIKDGVPPKAPISSPRLRPQPQYLAQSGPSGPTFSAPGGGNFIWPTVGQITQGFYWYHPGNDIANRETPTVVASDGGVVTVAGWPDNSGYGNRVVIDHGNGYQTLYAHLSNIYLTQGQTVSRGQSIGRMGSTGRSTGTHLHFEIRFKGIALNPLSILK